MILRYDQGMTTHTNTNVKIIEKAAEDDVCVGDHITWECSQEWFGATIFERREGIAHHRDDYGHWCTREGTCLTHGDGDDEYATLTIRRPCPLLAVRPEGSPPMAEPASRSHPECWQGDHYEHSCHEPSGRSCVECGAPAGTPWGPYFCPECDVIRLDRIDANLRAALNGDDQ